MNRKKFLTLVTILSTMLPYASILETKVFADTVEGANQFTTMTIPTTITKEDYLNYFHLNGSAVGKFDPSTGKQILTDSNHQSGNITFQAAIDLRGSFTINGAINIGKSNGQTSGTGAIADGIGFAFYKGQRDQVGGTGGNLGIYGIPNAFGWKLDTFTNVGKQDSLKGEPDWYSENNYYYNYAAPYGGFISTDDSGYGKLDAGSYKGFKYDEIADGKYHNIKIAYDGMTHKLTVTLDLVNGKQAVFNKIIDFNPNDPAYYFTMASSTGDTPLIQGFEFDSMTYEPIQKAIISYVDDTTGKEVKSDSVSGKAGDLINYSTNDTIQSFEKQGYVLLNDNFKPSDTFDNDELTDQTYQVHLIETGKIQANYLDEATNATITDSVSQTGRVNDPYNTSPASLTGYALDIEKLPDNRSGKITRDTQNVNYYYKKIDNSQVKTSKVTTKYVDESGKEIEGVPVQTQTGRIGDNYVTNPQVIDGYALDSDQLPTNTQGTFTKDNQEVTYIYKKVESATIGNGQVTTKYIDEETNQEIADQNIQKGRVEDPYATSAVVVKGYALDTNVLPENATGKYGTDDQTIIYKYKKVTASETENGTITVKYQDENGNALSSDQVIQGRVGDPYVTSAPAITDYALGKQPANHQGTITKDAQTVVYIYNKVETPVPINGKVTTFFETADGKEIAKSVTQTGRKGDSYTTSAITISGYALDEKQLPKNKSGQFSDQDQAVTYIYNTAEPEAIKNGDVQTVFVDGKGTAIADPVVQAGRIGDPYVTSALNVAGYALDTDQLPQNGSGSFTAEKQTVTYVYKKAETQAVENGQITAEYVDENNQVIAKPTILTGRIGDTYASNAINVAGYALDEAALPANAEGIYASVPQKIIYKYKKIVPNAVENGSIKVNYQDENGKELEKSSQFTGRINDAYTTNPIFIEGYSLVESKLPDNRTGKFTKENQTVTYIYKKAVADPIKNGTVETRYVDEKGQSISTATSVIGRVGDQFLTNPIQIKGYLLDVQKLPKNRAGKFTDENQTVTYMYKKVKAVGKIDLPKINRTSTIIPTKPVKQVSNEYSHTPSTLLPFSAKGLSGIRSNRMFNFYSGNTPASTNSVNNNYGKTYPKTNDQKSYVLTAIGAGVLSMFVALLVMKRRRKE